MAIKLSTKHLKTFVTDEEINLMEGRVAEAHRLLHTGTGAGGKDTGWVELPFNYDKEEFARIKAAAEKIRKNSEVFVVIGIGGSYLGARAAIEFVKGQNANDLADGSPKVYFAGNTLSSTYLAELIEICKNKDFSVNVISKSGTTTEPAVAFRIFRKLLIEKYGEEEAKGRIFATTDKAKGTLKTFADKEGYETFVVPDDVGGRYSVLTAVGLLPIAVAGVDLDELMGGAVDAANALRSDKLSENDCYKYAALRNYFYENGKEIELFVSYEPRFTMMNEWIKQLFGESEGKDGKGLFPASVIFSTDLHSMGQYIQQGRRLMFETVVSFNEPISDVIIEADEDNSDGLNFLAGKGLDYVNHVAADATILAHTDGNVPNIVLECDAMDERNLGYLFYFLEKACAISGYMLGVNPFNQPGVESYKVNMFALLGKPGYEDKQAQLKERLV